ncbi:MAG: ABC transporter permease [Actinobacteria bacterium]|nr:ABC transporter permease [Actinomycetota bacterium]
MIRPPKSWLPQNPRELWDFRGLLARLAARDLTLRYRQTFLGMIWVVLQPLLGAGALTFVFGSVAGLKGPHGVPIFVMSFASMTAWNMFGTLTSRSSGSLLGNSAMIQKVFFPRLLLPLSTLLSTLVDLGVSLLVMVGLLVYYRIWAGPAIILAPVWLALFALIGLGLGSMAASMSVRYRDIQYILPMVMQFLPFVSPVGFTLANAPHGLRWLVVANPMTGLLEAFRWSVLGTAFPPMGVFVYSIIGTLGVFTLGIVVFSRLERQFADVI